MEEEKIFIVGDIHGCLDPLERLMEKIDYEPERHRLIFLGDYIDRGPNPKGVVDYILDLRGRAVSVDCLKGNHESLLLEFLEGADRMLYFINGGETTIESYESARAAPEDPLIPSEHLEFYKSLEPHLELNDYYVVHAGFRPGVPINHQTLEDMLWIRESFIFSDFDFGKRVVFGHTPFHEPLVMENKIGLDTGAVYGNKLSCLELPDFRFQSVEV